jgi:hypothetical protein
MLARSALLLLLLSAALGFGDFDFTGDDGTIYHVDEVSDEVRAELEANGCDVDCSEMCWYLADGDMFIRCTEFCGCEELIEEKVEEIVSGKSGPPKEPDDEIVLREHFESEDCDEEIPLQSNAQAATSQPHKAWKTLLPAQANPHKAWKSTLAGNEPLRSSKPEEPEAEPEAEPTAAYGDCSLDCSQICSSSSESCLGRCRERFCAAKGWNLWEYLGTVVFLGAAVVGVFYILNSLKAKKTGFLLEDSSHRL